MNITLSKRLALYTICITLLLAQPCQTLCMSSRAKVVLAVLGLAAAGICYYCMTAEGASKRANEVQAKTEVDICQEAEELQNSVKSMHGEIFNCYGALKHNEQTQQPGAADWREALATEFFDFNVFFDSYCDRLKQDIEALRVFDQKLAALKPSQEKQQKHKEKQQVIITLHAQCKLLLTELNNNRDYFEQHKQAAEKHRRAMLVA